MADNARNFAVKVTFFSPTLYCYLVIVTRLYLSYFKKILTYRGGDRHSLLQVFLTLCNYNVVVAFLHISKTTLTLCFSYHVQQINCLYVSSHVYITAHAIFVAGVTKPSDCTFPYDFQNVLKKQVSFSVFKRFFFAISLSQNYACFISGNESGNTSHRAVTSWLRYGQTSKTRSRRVSG